MRRKDTTLNMTKGYMSQALLLLLERQPYDQITIGEITAKAGVDRSTYYRHFTCKEDIVRFYYNALMDECSRAFRKSHCTTFDSYMRIRFKILYLHKTDLLRLHRSNLTHLLLDVMMDRYGREGVHDPTRLEQEFRRAYRTGGIYSTIRLWLDHGMRESPECMAAMASMYRPGEPLSPWNQVMDDVL